MEGGVKRREFQFTGQMIKELGQTQREGQSSVSCPGSYRRGLLQTGRSYWEVNETSPQEVKVDYLMISTGVKKIQL